MKKSEKGNILQLSEEGNIFFFLVFGCFEFGKFYTNVFATTKHYTNDLRNSFCTNGQKGFRVLLQKVLNSIDFRVVCNKR